MTRINNTLKITLLSLFATQISFAYAVDCALDKKGYFTTKSWTGSCLDGLITGEGKGIFINNLSKEALPANREETIIGKFVNDSFKSGVIGSAYNVSSVSSNQYAHILYLTARSTIYPIDAARDESGLEIAYVSIQNSNILSRNSRWTHFPAGSISSPEINFDEAINRLYKYASQKNISGMDKDTFLSMVIEADYKKEIAIKEQMRDDPPVTGIKLSLDREGKSTKKSKKKTTN